MTAAREGGEGYCLCGRKIETTGGGLPVTAEYRNGECVYAVCGHGVAVIDNRSDWINDEVFLLRAVKRRAEDAAREGGEK